MQIYFILHLFFGRLFLRFCCEKPRQTNPISTPKYLSKCKFFCYINQKRKGDALPFSSFLLSFIYLFATIGENCCRIGGNEDEVLNVYRAYSRDCENYFIIAFYKLNLAVIIMKIIIESARSASGAVILMTVLRGYVARTVYSKSKACA